MAMEDSLFPDAPETPAPVFAYRALKGFIFGSPNDEGDDNSENTCELQLSEQRKSKPTPMPNLTPKKHNHASNYMSSPVKSILRPRGVATPRALHLQKGNVGVTFKDIRKSMSPEGKVSRRRAGATKTSPLRLHVTGNGRSAAAVAENPRPTMTAIEVAPPKPAPINPLSFEMLSPKLSNKSLAPNPVGSTAPTAGAVPFDLDAYIRTTEKEMKKLMRYGQKMREYARKQDDENAKLKQALEECRKENERLKAAEVRLKRTGISSPLAQETSTASAQKEAKAAVRKARVNTSAISWLDALVGVQAPKRSLDFGPQPPWPIPRRAEFDRDAHIRTDEGSKERLVQRQSSARLAPDRLAAARERIKLKAAKRKASDMSQVDWANL
jgi:Cut12 conserved domain